MICSDRRHHQLFCEQANSQRSYSIPPTPPHKFLASQWATGVQRRQGRLWRRFAGMRLDGAEPRWRDPGMRCMAGPGPTRCLSFNQTSDGEGRVPLVRVPGDRHQRSLPLAGAPTHPARKIADRHPFLPKLHREAVTSSVACGDTSSIMEEEGDCRSRSA